MSRDEINQLEKTGLTVRATGAGPGNPDRRILWRLHDADDDILLERRIDPGNREAWWEFVVDVREVALRLYPDWDWG